MPKKKKNGHSPNRISAQPGEYRSASVSRVHKANGTTLTRADPRDQGNLGSMLSNSNQSSFQGKEEIVKSMQEMFSHLDPVVIYIILSEADFKVENAMDAFLELSDAAEGKTTPPALLSGFEMAAALLDPRTSETEPATVASESSSVSETACLTEEFDTLIDQELQSLSLQGQPTDQHSPASFPLSSLPLPSQSVCPSSLPAQNSLTGNPTLSAFEHLDMENINVAHRGTSPIKELSFGGAPLPQESNVSINFSQLTEDSTSDSPRPSAFKAYHRPDQPVNLKEITSAVPHSEVLHNPALLWNIQAPEFQPRAEGPTTTPIMQAYNPWSTFSAAQWLAPRPFGQAPLKPSATIPKSWTLPPQSRLRLEGQVLVLLRGAPGSGKTTLASAMFEQNPGGVVLSTDEYFIQNGVYHFNPELLAEAHAWTHRRARDAFEIGHTPIIIDNTNLQCWEMRPYVAMALKHKYRVLFREPDTWWKTKPRELEKRSKHGVSKEKIRRMLEHQDRFVSVQNIMSSQPKVTAIYGVDVEEPQMDEAQKSLVVGLSRPDLVGDPRSVKHGGHLSSSLPDVSSVGEKCSPNSASMGAETGLHRSKEFKESNQKNFTEQVGVPQCELLDGAELDWELDAYVSLSQSYDLNKDIKEDSGMLEEKVLKQPMAFSSSIGKRVRRERDLNRFIDRVTTSQLPLNSELSNCSERQVEPDAKEDCIVGCVELKPELLDFVGDWPSKSLEQRVQRDRKPVSQTLKNPIQKQENSNFAEDIRNPHKLVGHSNCDGTNKTELQKFLDLQRGDNHLSQETNLDSQTFSENKQYPVLGTESHSILPDCVLDWKSGKSTDSEKDPTHYQSPAKEYETNQDWSSNKDTKKANTVENTPIHGGIQERNMHSETKECLTADTMLSLGAITEHNAEASQERWRGPGRRHGKACRLALTFTNQSPTSVCISAGSPVAAPQLPIMTPPPESNSMVQTCSQTDSQDFSLLWRLNHQKCSEPSSSIKGIVVLEGNSLRFVPESNKVDNSVQQEVPYRVCHERGSQVEESDLRELPFKQHSLEILSHHFKYVPMETLDDLYEKCHHDMEWIINLLLDSGEQFYKDEEEDSLKPQVDKKDYLAEITKDIQVTGQLPESKMATKRASKESSGRQSAVLATSNEYSSNSSSGTGEHEHSEHDVGKASEDKCLEHQIKGTLQEGEVEVFKCMSKPSIVTHLYKPVVDSGRQQDTLVSDPAESNTESELAPPEEVTSGSQKEFFSQYLDVGLAECVEEVGEEKKEENEGAQEQMPPLAMLEEMEHRKEEERRKEKNQGKSGSMDINTLELKLPTELALQLTEIFGPVGISPGECSPEDCSVLMDLNFAKLLHQKWKESIQERHRQAALSYHLLQESSVHWGEPQPATVGQSDSAAHFLIGAERYLSLGSQSGVQEGFPFLDHWNVSHPRVSLRDIMNEEQVMQDSLRKSRFGQWDLDKKDGVTMLKEKQLYTLFPAIDRHFLRDIFTDHNYSLEQTEQFLHALLDDGPVRNVIAPKISPDHNEAHRAPGKEQKWKQKDGEMEVAQFQDTEDPEYEDFRTEAIVQRRRQQECFSKAAEAYRQGRKDVASFYAQQGRLHGQKMKEANHRAAMQIFERVNATLLPQNVLDLHGLHVDEALQHLQQVLTDKTSEWQQGLCRPQLSVITGRGNRSQGGVARIRPAVLDYLKSQHYRCSEPKPGLILVTLH